MIKRNILAKCHLPILETFASSNVLVGFDYDGTLAPIAATPGRARMRAATRRLLTQLARCYPCVVISGRALGDVAKRLDRIPLWYVFGNHGLEPIAISRHDASRTREWVRRLEQRLPPHPGVVIEDKKYSITIHYRQVRDKRRALEAITGALRHLPEVRSLGGSQAVSILPRAGPNKGVALREARRLFACDTAIYIGDDDTDEDAFVSMDPDRLLSIRVGPARTSRARFRLRTQADIDALLRTLLALRESSDSRGSQRP